jgi:hypothetical protein
MADIIKEMLPLANNIGWTVICVFAIKGVAGVINNFLITARMP